MSKHFQLHNLGRFQFDVKDARVEKDKEKNFRVSGMKRTVEGVLLVHQHNHPHILLLQIGNSFFKLPGGKLKSGESEIAGLKRKLKNKLSPVDENINWEIGELLSVWWRPNFEPSLYPYIPPHISSPKERKAIYMVKLPDGCNFAVPRNLNLLAVPIFELYDNSTRYGSFISSIPHLLSNYMFNYANEEEEEE